MPQPEPQSGPPLQPIPTLIIIQRQPEHVLLCFDTSVGSAVYWLSLGPARKVGKDIIDAANRPAGLIVPEVVPPPDLQSIG